ncbi:hypothetical protein F4775DRAFT_572298 [Biscogniauxia sp. FL1348]|nr:hypothetical protein F4775DRAFT_572298 [Biscogniauxia sp. FL1348]
MTAAHMGVILPTARPVVTLQPSHKSALAMSRAQFLAHHAQNYNSDERARPPADKLFIGVCILHAGWGGSGSESERRKTADGPGGKREKKHTIIPYLRRRVTTKSSPLPPPLPPSPPSEGGEAFLLLRRRGCRRPGHKNDSTGWWELPGGEVGEDDFCVSAAAARLVNEQTGLRVVKITGALGEMRYARRSRGVMGRRREGRVLWWDDEDEDEGYEGYEGSGDSSKGGRDSGYGRKGEEKGSDRELVRECLQLNFTALVEDPAQAVLRSGDHDAIAWVDLRSARMSLAAGLPLSSSASFLREEEEYFF